MIATEVGAAPGAGNGKRAGEYLLFHSGREEFGVPFFKVREIIGQQDITTVPHTATCVSGVMNHRGKVVPVLDLRTRLGTEERPDDPRTCIAVFQVMHNSAPLQIGMIATTARDANNCASMARTTGREKWCWISAGIRGGKCRHRL